MPRSPRLDPPGTWHHVMNRGARRQAVFLDQRDHFDFVGLLGQIEQRFGVEVHLFCLVGNHFHALVRSRDGRISDAMKYVSERFTRRSNDRHGFDGPIFRGRFHSEVVSDEAHHRWLFRYIHRNARDAGWLGALAAFPWSSLGTYLGAGTTGASFPWLHSGFYSGLFEDDRDRMLTFVGDDESTSEIEKHRAAQHGPLRMSDEDLTGWVIGHALDTWDLTMSELLVPPRGACGEARMAIALVLVDQLSVPTSLVAQQLSLASAGSCRMLVHRARRRAQANPPFARQVRALTNRAIPMAELAA